MLSGMTMPPTITGDDLPWVGDRHAVRREEWHVMVAWSVDEPWRVGASATVREASILGRGGPQRDDVLPRLAFHARRPSIAEPRPVLGAARVSRSQLRLAPTRDGGLEVESVGRCTLLVDDVETEKACVESGAVLELKNTLVLYV